MNGHCLGSTQVLHWEESLSGQPWSPRTAYALYCLGPRPDTRPNQQKESPTIVDESLVSPKREHRCCPQDNCDCEITCMSKKIIKIRQKTSGSNSVEDAALANIIFYSNTLALVPSSTTHSFRPSSLPHTCLILSYNKSRAIKFKMKWPVHLDSLDASSAKANLLP